VVKGQLANQAHRFFIQEAALTEALGVRKAEEATNKRLHEDGQKYTTLLNKVVPFHAEIAELKDVAAATQVKMANLEARSITWVRLRLTLLRRMKPLRNSRLNLLSMSSSSRRAKRNLQEKLKHW